ncbi:penicillin-binding protein AmpH [Legionella steigerwaltii]|uniref:Penicillin-binding protein AmpH n=1 Tax=Legionella steigerwaltii TaxID=460 RepID=A0A378LEX1_9GAMM|nr:serine hydrolase domain-containing protein [Legionella steigerwaltii]KTD78203.1 penicillin-binding protein AmpH [Legionella steigerwaltii]STY24398.1 penicillin-binding protein AmpH [Legionella steigerwaltii]
MKKITLFLFTLMMVGITKPIYCATPLVELISAPASSQQVLPQQELILYYTLRNNTNVNLPLGIKFSSPSASLDTNLGSCGQFINANSTCTFAVVYQAPNLSKTIPLTVKINYQGRAPIVSTVNININNTLACTLLKQASWQTSFCQTQYQHALTFTPNVFNTANQNVVQEQTLGGMFGIYKKTNSGEQICFISCGLRALNDIPPDENTLFELASVTKTFTAASLGTLVYKNQINPLSPIKPDLPSISWLGRSFNLTPNESPVSYQELATFSGGVCFSDAPSVDQNSGDQTLNQSNFVKDINALDTALPTCIGNGTKEVDLVYGDHHFLPTHNFYSNSSVGLITQALMKRDGFPNVLEGDFNGWVCNNVTSILNMPLTSSCLPDEAHNGTCPVITPAGATPCNMSQWQSAQYASGYHIDISTNAYQLGNPFPYVPWAGAGCIRSNASDMINFVRANLNISTNNDPKQLALLQGMQIAHAANDYLPVPIGKTVLPNIGSQFPLVGGQGYAWVCQIINGETVCGKIGGHTNFRSFLGFTMQQQYGIIILFNTGSLSTDGSLRRHIAAPPSIATIGENMILNANSP